MVFRGLRRRVPTSLRGVALALCWLAVAAAHSITVEAKTPHSVTRPEETADAALISESQSWDRYVHDALGLPAWFDLGIEQEFTLFSQPSPIEGIDEVRIIFRRASGAPGDWRRSNRVFIHDLRTQFLLWRSLDTKTTEHYCKITLDNWDDLPEVKIDHSGKEST